MSDNNSRLSKFPPPSSVVEIYDNTPTKRNAPRRVRSITLSRPRREAGSPRPPSRRLGTRRRAVQVSGRLPPGVGTLQPPPGGLLSQDEGLRPHSDGRLPGRTAPLRDGLRKRGGVTLQGLLILP